MDLFKAVNIDKLSYALDVTSYKNKVISENIANVDTPFYKAKKLDFKDAMQDVMGTGKKLPLKVTNKYHISGSSENFSVSNYVKYQNNMSVRNDGNDVNLDYEMSELAANGILFNMLSQITGYEFTRLKTSIQGR
ncbi:flagellar basal-body rod protein FlgB [Deferribacter desulfuricans SSM1]|uniref:Flagellar basal body rod protein FlgB n=1 Tax=Deferribacter desulfuricans (strain DSM 14783 / JCM 11476 / NBRC 101012 / SSM1) TaxID=639282 RepID=D3PBP0_DEFDS|nr:flagellar basal body rod protein FlgB [Deferribacter desulfuricans]BAI80013.1 flagellar basal-body rod protein FlgB [Deferribacter desulfuricans SSM1]